MNKQIRQSSETTPSEAKHLDRRHFIQQSSSAVAAATLTAHGTWAVNTTPKKIRVGVVGGRLD